MNNSSTPQLVPVVAVGCTDIGCVRKENQDTWLVDEAQGLFVVADGVGGGPAGGTAAQMVTSTLPRLIAQRSTEIPQRSRARAVRRLLRESILEISREIRKTGEYDPGCKGMGTTVVAVWVRWPFAHIAHMGDSRAYLFRAGILTPLTADHSIVALLLRNGEISAEEAKNHPARGCLTRFVGMDGEVYPETQALRLETGDRLLLCTDGLWSAASDAEMQKLLSSASCKTPGRTVGTEPDPPEDTEYDMFSTMEGRPPCRPQEFCKRFSSHPDLRTICRELIALAKRHGGQDNITAVVVEIRGNNETFHGG